MVIEQLLMDFPLASLQDKQEVMLEQRGLKPCLPEDRH